MTQSDPREREKEVLRAMRKSERAHKAIHKYAIKFAGDEQAMTTGGAVEGYEDAYD